MQTLTSRSGLFPIGPSDFPLAPLLAGLIVACDPLLLNQQTLVMTETLATFLAILSLWCLARFDTSRSCFNAAFAGGAIGLAVLCRPTFLPWLLFVGLVMVVVRGRLTFRDSALRTPRSALSPWLRDFAWRLANLAGLAVACAAVMSPWAIRNYRVFGKPIVTTTHGGYTLLLGNNVSFYDWLEHDSSGLPWSAAKISGDAPYILGNLNLVLGMDLSSTVVVPQSEQALDAMNYRIAGRIIRQHPAIFTRACLYRLRQLWSPLPHKLTTDESTGRRLLRYATCTWYCSVYVLAVIGIWRLRWKLLTPPWIWGVLLCVAFTAVHTFYWTNLRMRAPLMPFVAIVAAGAVSSSKFNVPGSKLLNPEP
jgi:4-amino-4-deoxy-L-arabinose transferase-like glycosyltransferase